MLVREICAHPSRFSRVLPFALRRAPLLYAAAVLALGVAAGQWWWRPASLLAVGTGASVVLAAIALHSAARLAAMTTLLTWFLLGWTLAVLHPQSAADRSLLPYEDGLRREVVATVLAVQPLAQQQQSQDSDPLRFSEQAADQEAAAPQQVRYTADLRVSRIEQLDPDVTTMTPLTGTVRVTLEGQDGASLQCGQELRTVVRLYRPREFRDPGVWQYGAWLAEQQVSATGIVVSGRLTPLAVHRASLACRMQQVRGWAAGRLRRFAEWQMAQTWLPALLRWNQTDVAAWSAMLFGDRTALTHNLRASFERTGTFHLFVVSGMHLGLVAWAVFAVAERLRAPRWLSSLVTAAAACGYAVLTGFGEPVQRALCMTLVFLLAASIGRERNVLNAIGAAALAILVVRPQSLRDTSFQMTVLIALTIAGIAIPLLDRTIGPYARGCRHLQLLRFDRRLPPRVAQFRVRLRWIASELDATFGRTIGSSLVIIVRAALALLSVTVVSLVIELIMALPMALYFHRFTALALPSNLLLVPLILPMTLGMLTFLLSLISFPLALLAAVPASLVLHLAASLVGSLAAIHGADLRTPGPYPLAALALTACAGVCVVLLHRPQRAAAWTGILLAFAVAAGTVVCVRRIAAPHALQIAAIDVGQGDAILLVAPDGKAMLMDAGGIVGSEQDVRQQQRSAEFDIGEQVVSPYLWQRGIGRLDVLALSHAHMDHLGGMASVLRNFRPRELWLSEDVPSDRLHALVAQAKAQATTVRWLHTGDREVWQAVQIDVLSPRPDYRAGDEPANDDSLVLRVAYGRSSALLAGDAELPSEDAMLAAHLLTPVTLLKVGHHGSLTSSSDPFLDALSPRAAVISCGRGNHFGHPRMPVLQRLGQRHVLTSRTDTMGAVEYTLYEDGSIATRVPAAAE